MKKLQWDTVKWHLGHSAAGWIVQDTLKDFFPYWERWVHALVGGTGLGVLFEVSGIAGWIWGGGEQTKDSLTDIWQYSLVISWAIYQGGSWEWGLFAFGIWTIVYFATFFAGWTKP